MSTSAVGAMLEPRSIAVVGASGRQDSFGGRMVGEVLRTRADIDVHLVNPRYEDIGGRRCLPSTEAIDGPVDLVLLGVPDSQLEAELSRSAARGDRAA
ncbi:MAG TPA: CoA-binding protein, partial [Acidimicrobiales bacterium]|nr:CoA-binding protein [Acidimicrobiales bacterium]